MFTEYFVLKFIKVHEEDIVGRGKHTLKEAVTAVVEAIEEMRKVEIMPAADSVGYRYWVNQRSSLSGKDESGTFLLKAKALSTWVKYIFVMSTGYECCLGIESKYGL
jgi:hypothetical protein